VDCAGGTGAPRRVEMKRGEGLRVYKTMPEALIIRRAPSEREKRFISRNSSCVFGRRRPSEVSTCRVAFVGSCQKREGLKGVGRFSSERKTAITIAARLA